MPRTCSYHLAKHHEHGNCGNHEASTLVSIDVGIDIETRDVCIETSREIMNLGIAVAYTCLENLLNTNLLGKGMYAISYL